jgi:hypothetical protein
MNRASQDLREFVVASARDGHARCMRSWRQVDRFAGRTVLAGCVVLAACGGQSSSQRSDPPGSGGSAGMSAGGAGSSSVAGGSSGSGTSAQGESWVLQLGDFADDEAFAVGSDANDNVLVLLVRGLRGTRSPTPVLEKYDYRGALAWSAPISDSAPGLLAVQANGSSVIAGTVDETDATGSPSTGVVVTAYDPHGNAGWATQVGVGGAEAALSLNVDANGHTFLLWTNVMLTAANDDVFGELDAAGRLLFGASTSDPGTVYVSAIDPRGNLLEAGGAGDPFVRKHDSRGNQLWRTTLEGTPSGLSGDDQGSALVVGLLANGRGRLTKLDADGDLLFAIDFGDEAEFTSLVVGDAFGRTFTVGIIPSDAGNTWDVQAHRFDVDGTEIGSWRLGSEQRDTPLGVAVDSKGALLVVGMTQGAFPGMKNHGGTDAFIARIVP